MNCCTKPDTSNCDPRAHPIKSAGCCTPRNQCGEGQGDCDSDEDCAVFEALLPICAGFVFMNASNFAIKCIVLIIEYKHT